MKRALACLVSLGLLTADCRIRAADEPSAKPAAASPLQDDNFFPVAVWLQSTANASKYRAAGINTYVALWRGPTDEQLAQLKREGLYVICSQNAAGLKHKDDPTIIAWMHGDEPDNAQALSRGQKGYGPPVAPSKIIEDYQKLKATDPTRPVLLNLGQGVAWDNWYGRGVRTNHPEDYAEYVKGSDIASFDIYPACHDHKDVAGKLWLVADGVSRLKKWSGEKPVWNCIECTHIDNPKAKATPQQVKAEVWMSLIRGSQGLIYFCHQFKPTSIEAGLLADEEMVQGVTAVNRQIQDLAAVLHSPTIPEGVTVTSSAKDVPVEAIVKKHGGVTYVFAVAMREGSTKTTLRLPGATGPLLAEVLGENRQIDGRDGLFEDDFKPWDVHLYRMAIAPR